MSGIAIALFRMVGLPGIAVAVAFVFYEGLPGANYLTPYLRVLPAIGPLADDLAQGRVGRERNAGRLDERLVWQERQRREQLAREADKRAAQNKIDVVERDYLSRQMADAIKITELEKALEEEKPTDAQRAAEGEPFRCPVLSRRLRDAIDAIGRD